MVATVRKPQQLLLIETPDVYDIKSLMDKLVRLISTDGCLSLKILNIPLTS